MITVLDPGTYTTIQDIGRIGYQDIGVPVGGAVDKFSLRAANLLVGNQENSPALEITIYGPKLLFEEDAVIAITGGNLTPSIDGVRLDNWVPISVSKGSELSFSGPESGLRSYIAFSGGIDENSIDLVMNSFSTYVSGEFGGLSGRPLESGDTLDINSQNAAEYNDLKAKSLIKPPSFNSECVLRIIYGPNDEYFSDDAINAFTENLYSVAMDSDSVGIRLEGTPILHQNKADVISEGTAFGSIQIPGNGLPIILMSNRGTSGGYLKIATVISADHSKLAQLMPGNKVRFSLVTYEKAVEEFKAQERSLNPLRDTEDAYLTRSIMASDSLVTVTDESGDILLDKLSPQTVVAKVTFNETIEEIKIDIND